MLTSSDIKNHNIKCWIISDDRPGISLHAEDPTATVGSIIIIVRLFNTHNRKVSMQAASYLKNRGFMIYEYRISEKKTTAVGITMQRNVFFFNLSAILKNPGIAHLA